MNISAKFQSHPLVVSEEMPIFIFPIIGQWKL